MAKTKVVRKNVNWRRSEANGQAFAILVRCFCLFTLQPYMLNRNLSYLRPKDAKKQKKKQQDKR